MCSSYGRIDTVYQYNSSINEFRLIQEAGLSKQGLIKFGLQHVFGGSSASNNFVESLMA